MVLKCIHDGTYNEIYLKKAEVKKGTIYLKKDNSIVLYLGQSCSDDEFMFIHMGVFPFFDKEVNNWKNTVCETPRPDIWDKVIPQVIKAYLTNPKHTDIVGYKAFPKLKCIVPIEADMNYIYSWYKKVRVMGVANLPALKADNNRAKGSKFVRVKDLVPGLVYKTTNSGHRSTYIYLGRANEYGDKGDFIWHFVGNDNDYYRSAEELCNYPVDRTKNNKKVMLSEINSSRTPEQSKVYQECVDKYFSVGGQNRW